jgi:hypothetical protein
MAVIRHLLDDDMLAKIKKLTPAAQDRVEVRAVDRL